eukprot:2324-Heterococcus_DN1.PRE.3
MYVPTIAAVLQRGVYIFVLYHVSSVVLVSSSAMAEAAIQVRFVHDTVTSAHSLRYLLHALLRDVAC